MTKKCLACDTDVSDDHTGKCPKCGEKKGYSSTVKLSESVGVTDSIKTTLIKIQPETISKTLKLLAERQEELKKSLEPLVKQIEKMHKSDLAKQLMAIQNSTVAQQLAEFHQSPLAKQLEQFQNSPIAKQLMAIQNSPVAQQLAEIPKIVDMFNFEQIKVPKSSFKIDDILPKDTGRKGITADIIISEAVEKKPELKEAIESSQQIDVSVEQMEMINKKLGDLSTKIQSFESNTGNSLKDLGEKQEITTDTINQKLSPKQTIGIAIVVGVASSIIASVLQELWDYLGDIVRNAPIITNSTLP